MVCVITRCAPVPRAYHSWNEPATGVGDPPDRKSNVQEKRFGCVMRIQTPWSVLSHGAPPCPGLIIVGMNRQQALEILHEFTKSENLRKHALAVEACVTAYARKLGEDEEKWSVTALLHDFDWEIHPVLPDHP